MFTIAIYTILSIFKNSPLGHGQPPVADVAEVAFCPFFCEASAPQSETQFHLRAVFVPARAI